MKNILAMIAKATGATGDPVSLLIEPVPAGVGRQAGFSAALVNVPSNETITLEKDWKVDLAAEGTSIEEALKWLDEICAEDFVFPDSNVKLACEDCGTPAGFVRVGCCAP